MKNKKSKYDYIKQNVDSGEWNLIESATEALSVAKRLRKKRRIDELEQWIIQSPSHSVNYARNFLSKRWLEAEDNIFTNGTPKTIFLYIASLVKERCEKAEKIILNSSEFSYKYAKEILRRRWAEAEKSIISIEKRDIAEASNFFMYNSFRYARDVIQDRWEDLEEIIVNRPEALKYYAESVINDVLVEELHNRMICFTMSSDPTEAKTAKEYIKFAKHIRIDLGKKLKRFDKNLSLQEILQICENA
jgi:peptide subunit release factor 1 (eRF1)